MGKVNYPFLKRAQMLSIDLQTFSRQVTRKLEDEDIEGYKKAKEAMLKTFEEIEKALLKGASIEEAEQPA